MKNIIVVFGVLAFILGGCKSRDNESQPVNSAKKTEKYRNFDDELDTKSVATVDTVEFRKVMNTLLTTKRILELFGSGYHVFYLGLTIQPDGKVFASMAPDASWWITGPGDVERLIFKENIEITKDFAIIPNPEGDPKAIDLKNVFYFFDPNISNAFSVSPGLINGKKVVTMKIYQIDATIDNAGNIIRPWSIKELDVAKYRPQINTNLSKDYYMGYFPAVLKEDFKFIGQAMSVPREANARGVRGRVLVKLFYEADGKYAGSQVIKGLGYGCDEEVINTLNSFRPICYPSGQRSTVIVSFNFGPSDKTPVDVTVKSFEYDSTNPHNNLKMTLVNKVKITQPVKTKYSIYVFLDGNLILTDTSVGLNWDAVKGIPFWFGGNRIKAGEHDYVISIDPENVMNDIDRSNNTIKGTLIVK